MYHVPQTTTDTGSRLLLEPPVGLSEPCVTAERREHMATTASCAASLLHTLNSLCEQAGVDAHALMPSLPQALRELSAIAQHRVELETEAERQQRRAKGWLTRAEHKAWLEEQQAIADLHAEYTATRFNYFDR
jgi:hypothetical protein